MFSVIYFHGSCISDFVVGGAIGAELLQLLVVHAYVIACQNALAFAAKLKKWLEIACLYRKLKINYYEVPSKILLKTHGNLKN